MSEACRAVLQAALALPENERLDVANKIYESIPPPPGFVEMSEVEFVDELERRATEMEQGVDEGIPWSELKKMR